MSLEQNRKMHEKLGEALLLFGPPTGEYSRDTFEMWGLVSKRNPEFRVDMGAVYDFDRIKKYGPLYQIPEHYSNPVFYLAAWSNTLRVPLTYNSQQIPQLFISSANRLFEVRNTAIFGAAGEGAKIEDLTLLSGMGFVKGEAYDLSKAVSENLEDPDVEKIPLLTGIALEDDDTTVIRLAEKDLQYYRRIVDSILAGNFKDRYQSRMAPV